MTDDSIVGRISSVLTDRDSISICLPLKPTIDTLGAACALFLVLKKGGKSVSLSASEKLPQPFGLAGEEHLQTQLVSDGDNLVLSFPYHDGAVDKVTYSIEGNTFKLVIQPRKGESRLNPDDVSYSRSGGKPGVIVALYSPTLASLGSLYTSQQDQFTGVEIINIDRHFTNSNYGSLNYVDKKSASMSEMILEIVKKLGVEIDKDIATNLYAGVAASTNNFTAHTVNAGTFETIAFLMKHGAVKKSIQPQMQPSTSASQFGGSQAGQTSSGSQGFGAPQFGASNQGVTQFGSSQSGSRQFGGSTYGNPSYGASYGGASYDDPYGMGSFGGTQFGMGGGQQQGSGGFGTFGTSGYGSTQQQYAPSQSSPQGMAQSVTQNQIPGSGQQFGSELGAVGMGQQTRVGIDQQMQPSISALQFGSAQMGAQRDIQDGGSLRDQKSAQAGQQANQGSTQRDVLQKNIGSAQPQQQMSPVVIGGGEQDSYFIENKEVVDEQSSPSAKSDLSDENTQSLPEVPESLIPQVHVNQNQSKKEKKTPQDWLKPKIFKGMNRRG